MATASHRLDPLLRPRSVAIVGASGRDDTMGHWSLRNLLKGSYAGPIYPVNAKYDELQGLRCYKSLSHLPESPDLVIFGVGDRRIEAALASAIDAGIPAAVLMSSLVRDDENESAQPSLKTRISEMIRHSGMLVCGANGMGYYNVRDNVWACGFDSRMHVSPGNVSLISHSGSGMSGIIDSDERLRINVAVSTGNEMSVTMDAYLDFVLDLPETRAVGLFIETARNPDGLRAALQKAQDKKIPIAAIKVGKTERAAALTVSHSGAMAGTDATYQALFDRYGVARVRDMDELATTLIMFAELHPVGPGGLVTLHDSGGERQLIIDLAADAGVMLTELQDETVATLESLLDPELPAVNPLDAWSRGGSAAGEQMMRCLSAMMSDSGAAIGAVIHDRAPDGVIYHSYIDYMQYAHTESAKPVALVAARQGTGHDNAVVTSTHAGYPVLDGVPQFLRGVRALFDYRDFLQRGAGTLPRIQDPAAVTVWQAQLAKGAALGEFEALALLGDAGIDVVRTQFASTIDDALLAARATGYPVVLKTAASEILHKTDKDGVRLNIRGDDALRIAYNDVAGRLGPDVLIAEMLPGGIEMLLGVRSDPQFGPVVLIGFGGVYAEVLRDVTYALPPFDATHARRCVDSLRLRPLLNGVRGRPAVAVDAFCQLAAQFSVVVAELGTCIMEFDVNPVIVHVKGATVADALIIGSSESP